MGSSGVGCGSAQGGRMGDGHRDGRVEGSVERLEEGVVEGGKVRRANRGGGDGWRGAGVGCRRGVGGG